MPEDNEKPSSHPVGEAIAWTAEDIKRLSIIDTEDEAEARKLWQKHVRRLKSLLDAKDERDRTPSAPPP